MKIAFTHNLRLSDAEEEAEFDPPETIEAITAALSKGGHEVLKIEVSGPASHLASRLEAFSPDLIFNIAEGRRGRAREAFYPALFEELGYPYTGSDAYALTVTLDKFLTKQVLRAQGIDTPQARLLTARDLPDAAKIDGVLGGSHGVPIPAIIKPNFEGSSKGISDDSVTVSLTMGDTVTAWFMGTELPLYDFTLDVYPPGSGSATVEAFTPGTYPYATTYTSGNMMNLEATPAPGFAFDYWSLENHTANPDPFVTDIFFTLSDLENATAHFRTANAVNDNQVNIGLDVSPSATSGQVDINYQLSNYEENIRLEIFAVTGQLIAVINQQDVSGAQGKHTVNINLQDYKLADGMYFIKLTAGSESRNERVILNY